MKTKWLSLAGQIQLTIKAIPAYTMQP